MDPRTTSQDCVPDFREIYARKQAAEQHLSFARPEMELLSNQIAGSNHLIAFGDAGGVVLDLLLDAQSEGTSEAASIIQGSVWREDLRGTNALGLVATLGKSATVLGAENFLAANAHISCLAAPIFRSDGMLAGVLNAPSPASDWHRHLASLLNLAVLNISNRIFVEDHRQELIVFCHSRQESLATQNAGLLSFDQDGRMAGAMANARDVLPDIADLAPPLCSDILQDGYDRAIDSIHSGEAALPFLSHGPASETGREAGSSTSSTS